MTKPYKNKFTDTWTLNQKTEEAKQETKELNLISHCDSLPTLTVNQNGK